MNKENRNILKKHFNRKACPLFGPLPLIYIDQGSIVRDCERIINKARAYLYVDEVYDSTHRHRNICPSVEEIKDEIARNSEIVAQIERLQPIERDKDEAKKLLEEMELWFDVFKVDEKTKDQVTRRCKIVWVDPGEQQPIERKNIKLNEIIGFDEEQVISARSFHKQITKEFSGKWTAIFDEREEWPNVMSKVATILWGRNAEERKIYIKERNIHPDFDDWDALAILSISLAYAILGDMAAGIDGEYLTEAIDMAESCLEEAKSLEAEYNKLPAVSRQYYDDRQRCRRLTRIYIKHCNKPRISDAIEMLRREVLGRRYRKDDTIRNWIKELFPPESHKPGRQKKS